MGINEGGCKMVKNEKVSKNELRQEISPKTEYLLKLAVCVPEERLEEAENYLKNLLKKAYG